MRASSLVPGLVALAVLCVAHPAAVAAQDGSATASPAPRTGGWRLGFGLGLAVDAGSTDGDVDRLGLGGHASLARDVGPDLRLGLQWNGAHFDGQYAERSRNQLTVILERTLGDGPLRLRGGPGLGWVRVVTVEGGPFGPGRAGDLNIGIGDHGAWGALVGLAVAGTGPGRAALAGHADFVYQRAAGFDVATFVVGARVLVGL